MPRVCVLEINEISWDLMAPWLNAGQLPNFARLKARGATGTTTTDEPGGPDGLLEPWVTWTTLYTGVPYDQHGVKFLEQPAESMKHPRIWDLAAAAGKSLGMFGTGGTWPPKNTPGFTIPGSFSQDSQTHPEDLRPIQDLNLRYTRAHAPGVTPPTKLETLKRGLKLLGLGLNAATVARVAKVLFEIKRYPDRDWKKVSLQPAVNLPFFRKLFAQYKPDFSTFHTNHVAHYQHRFMRAYRPDSYPDPTDPAEIARFGTAIEYGYRSADWLLGEFLRMTDRNPDVVLCVASSMGQQPYIPPKYGKIAPPTCRLRSIEKLVGILGLKGKCDYFSTMAPQWNLKIADANLRKSIIQHLFDARYMPANKSMYTALEQGDTVVITPISHHGLGELERCTFPTLPGAPSVPFNELVIQADDTRKSGSHHPTGLLAFYGKPVKPGDFGQVNNIDIAPTLLTLLGVETPSHMAGRDFAGQVLNAAPAAAKPQALAV
jgi:hypothetical protein